MAVRPMLALMSAEEMVLFVVVMSVAPFTRCGVQLVGPSYASHATCQA
jgi:hypothetical protein